jgi:amino acid adenylation domain-containing protein
MKMNHILPQHLASWVFAARNSRAVAVRCGERWLSYQQLAAGARNLAQALPPLQVERPVYALVMKKSIDAVQAIVAVLSIGGCYAPLDASYPVERLKAILGTLKPRAVLTDSHSDAIVRVIAGQMALPVINIDNPTRLAEPMNSAVSQPMAAILHTSGSTGLPKSVHIGAAQIHAFTDWVINEFNLSAADRVLNHAPLAFDLTFLDLFATFRAGATLILTTESEAGSGARLRQICHQQRATVWHSTPTSLRLLLMSDELARFPDMRAVMFAGEPMPGELLTRLVALFPGAEFYNIYGSSEANDTFCYRCPKTPIVDIVPMGYPLAYTDWLLLDEQQQPVDPEAGGELWVHCPTLMAGYGDARLTQEVFRQFDGKRYFRTRDRVRRDAQGIFHFLGRCDWIVKLNGFRVDLLDVEQIALRSGCVEECVAFVSRRDGERQLELVAYGSEAWNTLMLRQYMARYLPPYALPRRYHQSKTPLQKNSNGKLCRRSITQQFNP